MEVNMKRKRVTLDDIADRAYVSKSLVSKVLNNRPVRVSEEKRLEILYTQWKNFTK